MDFVLWNDSFSIGVPEIDKQHKKLIGIFNKVADIVYEESEDDIEKFETILDEMINYIGYHFKSEEDLMKKYDYPGYKEQRKQHSFYVLKSMKFNAQNIKTGIINKTQVFDFLKEWLINHILVSDRKIGDFLKKKGIV